MAVAHPPLAVPAATTLPLLSLFCQRDFSGGELLGYTVTTTPPLSRDVSALLGPGTSPSGSPCRSEVRKKGNGDGRSGSCQHRVWAGRGEREG